MGRVLFLCALAATAWMVGPFDSLLGWTGCVAAALILIVLLDGGGEP